MDVHFLCDKTLICCVHVQYLTLDADSRWVFCICRTLEWDLFIFNCMYSLIFISRNLRSYFYVFILVTCELSFVYAGRILVIWFLTKDYPAYAVITLLWAVVWFEILLLFSLCCLWFPSWKIYYFYYLTIHFNTIHLSHFWILIFLFLTKESIIISWYPLKGVYESHTVLC